MTPRVVVVGAGMVGLLAARLFADLGYRVTVIEARERDPSVAPAVSDPRVVALNAAQVALLDRLGVSAALAATTQSDIRRMHIWDDLGGGHVDFDAADIAQPWLARVVSNAALVEVLWQQLQAHAGVELCCPATITALEAGARDVRVTTSAGVYTAELVVGADGAHSAVRRHVGVACRTRSYQQQAVVAVVRSARPHQSAAYQAFTPTGPLGVLPLSLPDHEAIVWSQTEAESLRLQGLSLSAWNCALTTAMQNRLGGMECVSARQAIPLVARSVSRCVVGRTVLVGDAAHTIHPLAGQGANLGMQDVALLAEAVSSADVLHSQARLVQALQRYQRQRLVTCTHMAQLMRFLAELYDSPAFISSSWRSQVMSWLNNTVLCKSGLMDIMRSS